MFIFESTLFKTNIGFTEILVNVLNNILDSAIY